MEKLFKRKEAANMLGIGVRTLDSARMKGQISFIQHKENGCVYFTESALQEFVVRGVHKAKPIEVNTGFRGPRSPRRK